MRIVWLKALLGILVLFLSEVPGATSEMVCTIRGRNLSGHITRVWTSVTDVQYHWWVFREGKISHGAASPDPDRPGRYLLKREGELLALAGWFQTNPAFLPGNCRLRADGYIFRTPAGSGLTAEVAFRFSDSIPPWADRIHLR